jgi:dTDP-4-amino-4,6-dideoxygalactose transaminase
MTYFSKYKYGLIFFFSVPVLGVSDLHHDSNATAHVPLFRSLVPVGRPNMGDKELFLGFMNQIWASRHLSNDGPLLQRFERELAAICGVKHAICVSNATLGLELLFGTLPIVPGVSEVIVPSFTFVATVHALKRQGIVPVFCDIDPKTYSFKCPHSC